MIDHALELVRDRLNDHLSSGLSVPEAFVVLAPLTDSERKPVAEVRDRLAIFLANVSHDQIPRGRRLAAGREETDPLHLDIHFVLAAGHGPTNYAEGLKLLSMALGFFQATPVLTPRNTPNMSPGLAQLSIEISNLRMDEIGHLWGNWGGQYVPSVMFKMRSVVIDSGAFTGITPPVRRPELAAHAEQ